MKFSEKWLREWIDVKIDSNILYEQIANSGIEVEYIKNFKTQFSGVIVGKIVECISHSLSNELKNDLKIVKVDIGKKKLLNIVCRAWNCRNGIKVAVATIGAILKDKIIDTKTIQGELSEGMLCSFFELGVFLKNNTIIEFSQDIPIGINVNDYLRLEDNIIKTSITANRPDGLSILGISRNIAAMNNFKKLFLENISTSIHFHKKINIDIQAKQQCSNFLGRIINNINVNVDTPLWMKKKLFFSDMLSENIIINIINYVLIEIGQPLNIFNTDNIDDLIIVRMAENQEYLFLKDNIKIELNKNILVFSNKNEILSLPGNINSIFSEISKNTKNIFLSSCLINKESILDILKKIDSNTMLEYYHYGIDSSLQNYAIEYATQLILKICGGEAGVITHKNNNLFTHKNNSIRVYYKTLQKIIGISIKDITVSKILYNLDYKINTYKKYWDVIPPSWRFDILIEEDVINDVIRIYGYHNIFLNPLKEHINFHKKDKSSDYFLKKSAKLLINRGYYEVINYSFINPKIENLIFKNKENILISNPISQDMSCMRSSLWPGLLKNVSYNKNRQQQSIRIFERGLCFSINKKENLSIKQEIFLAALISGNHLKESWFITTRKADFYDLKGDLELILDEICELDDIEFRREKIFGLHPEQSASIYFQDDLVGKIGAIDPRLEKKLNVNSSTFLFEISLKHFSQIKKLKFQEISKFPTIRRDIAIIISEDTAVHDVIKTCKNFFITTTQIVEINLFDIYSYQASSNMKKSLGISFIFQNNQRTLKDNEINLMINNCIEVLEEKFQVILRK
ncbi:phenylalanine--tRNA ligase subunit beta [Buchnera aphidicola (Macrosiphoniella sanborni)]|uniref:Phenylalanine--tRNA ligase beta subunit n=1 Tax=Buchnera aphidicola (Macrosiphoniella sanborni) TaxID=1241865 RepID=A0A4D6YCC4_9GAMM|nr:phenylalanine--tRNA ligase subunit beta [Buchnera aphidicola]QCI23688.1 phenylalanine--tRNA ligase subunit beta [Buchnera aphidicola (Macrosiphoniella sanborni)]